MLQIGFPIDDDNDNIRGVITITNDVADMLRNAGHDPAEFNRFRWPLGASNHAHCRVLMTKIDVEAMLDEASVLTPRKFTFGDIRCDRMYILVPQPIVMGIVPKDNSGSVTVLYAVDVVDERWLWRRSATNLTGFNVSLDDKELLYNSTQVDIGSPYSVKTAIQALLDELQASASIGSQSEFDLAGLGTNTDDLRDLYTRGKFIPELIDHMLTLEKPGYVLSAAPNITGYWNNAGKRYRLEVIEEGATKAKQTIDEYRNAYLAGGIIAAPIDTPNERLTKLAVGDVAQLNAELPSKVRVLFPKAAKANELGYVFNTQADDDPLVHYTTKRFHSIESSNGRPEDINGNNTLIPTLHDSTWALMDGASTSPTNSTDLEDRADDVAEIYFSRFKCGAGMLLFAGTQPIVPYAGAQIIEWIANASGAFTRISSEFHYPLFGWRSDRKLTANDVFSTGQLRGFPNPYGGVLIDAPLASPAYPVDFIVGAATEIIADKRWSYALAEAQLNDDGDLFEEKTDGVTVDAALNRAELVEPSDFENLSCGETPIATVTRKPVPEGRVVQVRFYPNADDPDAPFVWFDTPNPVCVECST